MIRLARTSDLHQIRFLASTEFAPYAMRMRGLLPVELDLGALVHAGQVHVFMRQNAIRAFVVFYTDGPDLHVVALAVSHRLRRGGIGRMLLDVADRRGLAEHCRRTIVHSAAQAFENLAYFRAKGLIETDRRRFDNQQWVILERYLH